MSQVRQLTGAMLNQTHSEARRFTASLFSFLRDGGPSSKAKCGNWGLGDQSPLPPPRPPSPWADGREAPLHTPWARHHLRAWPSSNFVLPAQCQAHTDHCTSVWWKTRAKLHAGGWVSHSSVLSTF